MCTITCVRYIGACSSGTVAARATFGVGRETFVLALPARSADRLGIVPVDRAAMYAGLWG